MIHQARTVIPGLVAVCALLTIGLRIPPALAVCTGEQATFIEKVTPNTSGVPSSFGYGTISTIFVRDRSIDPSYPCGNETPEAHSTSHFESQKYYRFAEVGWEEIESNLGKTWTIFTEGGVGEMFFGPHDTGPLSPGSYASFRVRNIPNSTSFTFAVDTGAGYFGTGPDYDLGFKVGVPMAETGRRGSQTGATDHHKDMQYQRDVDRQWLSWGTNFKSYNVTGPAGDITNYDYVFVAADEYRLCPHTAGC